MKGKLSMAAGFAAGYVLGARAGRERYEQIEQSARRLAENPSMQRLSEELKGMFGTTRERAGTTAGAAIEQAADKAADQASRARTEVAAPSADRAETGTASPAGEEAAKTEKAKVTTTTGGTTGGSPRRSRPTGTSGPTGSDTKP